MGDGPGNAGGATLPPWCRRGSSFSRSILCSCFFCFLVNLSLKTFCNVGAVFVTLFVVEGDTARLRTLLVIPKSILSSPGEYGASLRLLLLLEDEGRGGGVAIGGGLTLVESFSQSSSRLIHSDEQDGGGGAGL